MIQRLSIAAILAATIALPFGQNVSHAEQIRVSLAQAKALPAAERLADGPRLLALPESHGWASVAPTLPDESQLSDLLDLHLQPTPLLAPAEPGQHLGHGDVVLSLPIWKRWQLRTGVRVGYENRPRIGTWQLEWTPTVSIGVRF